MSGWLAPLQAFLIVSVVLLMAATIRHFDLDHVLIAFPILS